MLPEAGVGHIRWNCVEQDHLSQVEVPPSIRVDNLDVVVLRPVESRDQVLEFIRKHRRAGSVEVVLRAGIGAVQHRRVYVHEVGALGLRGGAVHGEADARVHDEGDVGSLEIGVDEVLLRAVRTRYGVRVPRVDRAHIEERVDWGRSLRGIHVQH